MKDQDKRVVGLQYELGEGLPRVILKGSGKYAEAIIERREALRGPPIVKDEKLLRELYRLPMDSEIGPELFELVAVLLVHVFAVEAREEGEAA
jgi:flagellar biosynthesis protein